MADQEFDGCFAGVQAAGVSAQGRRKVGGVCHDPALSVVVWSPLSGSPGWPRSMVGAAGREPIEVGEFVLGRGRG